MTRRTPITPSRALCLVGALALVACGGATERHDPSPTVATAHAVRGGFTLSRDGGTEERVRGRVRVEDGATAATGADGRGALALDSGAWVLFDRGSSVVAHLGSLTLGSGRLWVDASSASETSVETAHGTFVATEAAFAISIGEEGTVVYCGSGEITYRSPNGEGRLAQGETLRATGSGAPTVEPEAMWDDWTGGLADPARARLRTVSPIGVLAGRASGARGIARVPLPVRSHEVNVAVRGDLAVTEVVQTFFNARSETLEGEWAIRLPRGAIVQGFAVDTGAGFTDGVVQSIQVNAGYQLSWLDPSTQLSKLTYDGPERLRARIHPVEPGATVRVRLRYTEWLDREHDRRTYVYPMRSDGEPPLLGEFVLTVDTSAGNVDAMRAGMGASEEQGRVVLRRSDFRPQADFYLDLYDRQSTAPTGGVVYRVSAPRDGAQTTTMPDGTEQVIEGEHDYVLFDLPTDDVTPTGDTGEAAADAPLELAILLDVSGATDPEDLEIARAVVEAVLRQLAPTDRVTLRLADVTAHVPEGAPEALSEASDELREQLLESIARVDLGGATDLGESLRAAATLVAGRPRGAVLYLGDALPTTGGLDATALRTTLATLDAPPRFFGLAIGDGANVDLLRALFGAQASAVRDRESAARAVMEMLADAAQPTLRGVSVDLGEGIERVYPHGALTLAEGAHVRLVGRLVGELPDHVVLRGTRDGAAFEHEVRLTQAAIVDEGDIRRRWATSRLAELLDADAGREAMVELGTRFSLVTPWTASVVGAYAGGSTSLVDGFDHDPLGVAWGLGGGGAGTVVTGLTGDELGWRRRMSGRETAEIATAPEATWASRVDERAPLEAPRGRGTTSPFGADGGLGRASVDRVLSTGERGPRQCYERRALVRPDLSGDLSVALTVAGDGSVREARVANSSLSDADVEQCVLGEVRGLRFAGGGGTSTISVTHTYYFRLPEREFGTRRQCSDASMQSLETRRALWRERLAQQSGVQGALTVWREARGTCELGNWHARRTLLDMMLRHVGGVRAQVDLYRSLVGDSSVASYLRRAILRNVRSAEDVIAVRYGLGLDPQVEWAVFSRLWRQNADPAARLRLVRAWLEVAPEELDLRLRLLALLEQTSALPEARRVARELREDPLADARVRTAVGEFWLRQGDEPEARRVFSEIVEHAPLDPWARRRLGDLYRAHGWADDAYREYQTLARLRPGEGEVWLLLARAAADSGRTDEALRLEQRLSESTEPGVDEGAAAYARLWTQVRLARMWLATDDATTRTAIRRRVRETGALRDPPDVFVALSWSHPDDALSLGVHYPGYDAPTDAERFDTATLGGTQNGIWALRIREREDGDHLFQITRADTESLRETDCELLVIVQPGTEQERILRAEVHLTRELRTARFRLTEGGDLEPVPVPPPRPATR